MTLLYVTVQLPHGCSEAFFLPEIRALIRLGHKVVLVPRSPGGPVIHDTALLSQSVRQGLFSPRVLASAAALAFRHPLRVLRAIASLTRGRSLLVGLKNLAVVPKALWLARLAQRLDATHIHCQWAASTATMAMIASRLSGVPWSFTAHRGDIVENNLLAVKASHASFVRFISRDGVRMARDRGLGPDANVLLLHMGVDVPPQASWRPPSRPVLLCPARLSAVKGHSHLLEALRILLDRGLPVELLLAGEGESLDSLQSLSRRLALHSAVRFLGPVAHRELLALYEHSAVSAVVLPSLDLGHGLHEGIPVALIEAMSYAVPVISTNTGAIAELVAPGTGILVPPAASTALASALEALLRNPQAAIELGLRGRHRVLAAFDQAHIVRRLAGACESAARPPPPRVPLAASRPAVPITSST